MYIDVLLRINTTVKNTHSLLALCRCLYMEYLGTSNFGTFLYISHTKTKKPIQQLKTFFYQLPFSYDYVSLSFRFTLCMS